MKIEKLVEVDGEAVNDINQLNKQLSSNAQEVSIEYLTEIIQDKNIELFVARDERRIVGMGCLALIRVPEKLKGRIEDVVVHAEYRKRGIGQEILEKLVAQARVHKVKILELSSNARREAANKLYAKLGFEVHETNVYRFYL